MYLIIILYAVFAGTFCLGKFILHYTQPLFAIGMRMSIAGLIILTYQWLRSDAQRCLFKKEHWFIYLKMMVLTVFIPYCLRGWGLQYMPACKASFLYNCGPFISYALSCLLYQEKVRFKKLLGLCIGFIGLLFVLLPKGLSLSSSALLPDLAMIASVGCISYGWLMAHDLIKKYHYNPLVLNGIGMAGGGIMSLVLSWCVEDHALYVQQWLPFLSILATIIVISNLVCHNLYANLLKVYTPTMLSFGGFITPFFTGLYGWLLFNETISISFFIANGIVMIGIVLFYYEELNDLPVFRPAVTCIVIADHKLTNNKSSGSQKHVSQSEL